MGKPSTTATERQRTEHNRLKAIGHPLRAKILLLLGERTLSPAQIAREISGDVREISRHCRMLEKLECAEIVSTRQVRGATEHFYCATEYHLVEDDEWEQLHPVQKDHFLGDIAGGIVRDMARSFEAKMLGSDEKAELTRTPLTFDREGQGDALEIVKRARRELTDVAAASADRLAGSDEQGIAHASFFGLFEIPLS
jgi:hypothetical protein